MTNELFADAEKREISGMLLPYGEKSQMNATGNEGVVFSKGAITIPRDPAAVGLNLEHDRFTPIGRVKQLEETDAGITAIFSIDNTDEGDAALAAVKAKRLRMFSPEVAGLVHDGLNAIRSRLSGAGLVEAGAFAGAQLFALGEVIEEAPQTEPAPEPDTTPAPAEADETPAEPEHTEEEETVPDAQIPNGLPAPAGTATIVTPEGELFARKKAAGELFAKRKDSLLRIASATASPEDFTTAHEFFMEQGNLFALSDLDYDGTDGLGAKMTPPQWLGENRGPNYIQRFAPLFNQQTLTSLSLGGFRWGTKPVGATWAGNKAAISSNVATIVAETETATRWAGGHDIAREHKDFRTPGFFESYEYWMRRSFFEWLDKTIVLTEALAGATDIEADNPGTGGIGAALSAMIDGAAAVIDAGYTPTFAVLDTAYWKTIAKVPNSDVLGYLNAQLSLSVDGSQSLDSFAIVPAPVGTITANHVLVGSRDAATVFTLPGAPIRAEAENIANGGLDIGFFGYGALKIENAAALVDVGPYTP